MFIEKSIGSETIAEAIALVVLVIFPAQPARDAIVTIPVSLVGAFGSCTPSASPSR